jgi:cellobiose-specific phosphotransferase system component IIA
LEKKEIISILEKWSKKYKRSIDCSNPKGFSQKAHCAGRRKRKQGGKTKSRPVESLQEISMSDIKKFLVEEINKTVNTEMAKKKIKQSSKNLYEAVKLTSELKKEGKNKEKIKIAEGLVVVAEKQLADSYDQLDSDCDCGEEGEGEMFKAQLLSIMTNAQKLYHMIDEEDGIEDWVQSKITIAEDYLQAVYGYMVYQNGGDDAEMGDDWDDEDGWDEMDEEDWDGESYEDDGMDVGVLDYDEALDADIDDDEIFESKKK